MRPRHPACVTTRKLFKPASRGSPLQAIWSLRVNGRDLPRLQLLGRPTQERPGEGPSCPQDDGEGGVGGGFAAVFSVGGVGVSDRVVWVFVGVLGGLLAGLGGSTTGAPVLPPAIWAGYGSQAGALAGEVRPGSCGSLAATPGVSGSVDVGFASPAVVSGSGASGETVAVVVAGPSGENGGGK